MPKTPRKSFVMVYNKLALPLTKFIVKRVGGDQEAAEEVFSRTVVAAWTGWHTFEHKSTYFTWMCRIALNKIADYYREEVNRKTTFISPFLENLAEFKAKNPSPEEEYILEEISQNIKKCINLLPYERKRLLFLRYWKYKTNKEIAKLLGISERAVEGRLYRARQSLAKVLVQNSVIR